MASSTYVRMRRLASPSTVACAVPQGASDGERNVAIGQYFGRGPYRASQLPPIRFVAAPGSSGPLESTLRVTIPQGGGGQQRWPLVVLSAGFLLHSDLYGSYAADLASWGLAVARYDVPELVDDTVMVSTLGQIINICTKDPRVGPHVDERAVLLAGHSRGGKLSVLTAAGDARVKGLALLDPVDVTAMTPAGPGYPSALPAMRLACGPPHRVPALVVGAARNTSIIPADANYKRFVSNCPGPCWSLELQCAGHLQFLDSQVELLSMFVESGPAPDESVRAASRAAVLAWALELAVPLARGEAVSGQQAASRLQEVAAAIQRRTPVASALRGFERLVGPTEKSRSVDGGGNSSSGSSRNTSGTSSGGRGKEEGAAGSCTTVDASSSSGSTYMPPRSTSSSAPEGGSAAAGVRGGTGSGGSKWSYETLLAMRARELKAILAERGVECSDCFEKEGLVRRIMERC